MQLLVYTCVLSGPGGHRIDRFPGVSRCPPRGMDADQRLAGSGWVHKFCLADTRAVCVYQPGPTDTSGCPGGSGLGSHHPRHRDHEAPVRSAEGPGLVAQATAPATYHRRRSCGCTLPTTGMPVDWPDVKRRRMGSDGVLRGGVPKVSHPQISGGLWGLAEEGVHTQRWSVGVLSQREVAYFAIVQPLAGARAA